MSQFKITLIDQSLNAAIINAQLNGLSFEYVSRTLRSILGHNYFIYEGSNHIIVQAPVTNKRVMFIERS